MRRFFRGNEMIGLGIVIIALGAGLSLTGPSPAIGIFVMLIGGALALWAWRRRRTDDTETPVPANSNLRPEPVQPFIRALTWVKRPEAAIAAKQKDATVPTVNAMDADSTPRYDYDRAKWTLLVEYDDDIARIHHALLPYGQYYVDQLASIYLTLNDKQYLPKIVDKIIASARENALRRAG
jgi:hypothetical protein